MHDVSLFRLYVLRAMYLFIVLGLGIFMWPGLIDPQVHWGLSEGYSTCMVAAFSLMCLLGLRYPLRMLPVLLWEVTWKTMWLVIVPLPQWLHGHVDDAIKPGVFAVSMVALVYLAVPWGYVVRTYAIAPGERWRNGRETGGGPVRPTAAAPLSGR